MYLNLGYTNRNERVGFNAKVLTYFFFLKKNIGTLTFGFMVIINSILQFQLVDISFEPILPICIALLPKSSLIILENKKKHKGWI